MSNSEVCAFCVFVYMHNITLKKISLNIILLLFSIALFCSAVCIYIGNRSNDMILYSWLEIDAHNRLFEYIRQHCLLSKNWLIYNLPDGLWLLSYLLAMESIWGGNKRGKWIFCIPVIVFAIMMEFLQFKYYLPGTGDILDIIFYLISIIIFLLIIKLKQMSYESN